MVYGDDGDSGTGYGDHMFHHLEHKRNHTRVRSHNKWLSWKYIFLFEKRQLRDETIWIIEFKMYCVEVERRI